MTDSTDNQHILLAARRRTLAHLLQQPKMGGDASTVVAEARAVIAQFKAALRAQGIAVADAADTPTPDDTPAPTPPSATR